MNTLSFVAVLHRDHFSPSAQRTRGERAMESAVTDDVKVPETSEQPVAGSQATEADKQRWRQDYAARLQSLERSVGASRGSLASDVRYTAVPTGSTVPAIGTDSALRNPEYVGEQRLMLAVLEEGVRCALKAPSNQQNRRLIRESRRWMDSDSRKGPFTFRNLCDVLEIDANRLRRRVRQRRGPDSS